MELLLLRVKFLEWKSEKSEKEHMSKIICWFEFIVKQSGVCSRIMHIEVMCKAI